MAGRAVVSFARVVIGGGSGEKEGGAGGVSPVGPWGTGLWFGGGASGGTTVGLDVSFGIGMLVGGCVEERTECDMGGGWYM